MILGKIGALNTAALNFTSVVAHPEIWAGLTKGALNSVAINGFATTYAIEPQATGAARVYNSFEAYGSGNFNLVIFPVDLFGLGLRRRFNEFTGVAPGLYSQGKFPFSVSGGGLYQSENSFEIVAPGRAALYGNLSIEAHGSHGISFDAFSLSGFGRYVSGYGPFEVVAHGANILQGYGSFELVAPGSFKFNLLVLLSGSGLCRVAGDLERYELYRGVNGLVDFSAPYQTFETIPFTTPALDPGNSYNFVLRKRNQYNLVSQNIEEFTLAVGDLGEIDLTPPTTPIFVMSAMAGGKMFITGFYDYPVDGYNQGDQWLIYLTDTGSDPNPEIDTPIVVKMSKVDGVARLSYTTANFADDAPIKALVRVRRSDGPVDSINNNTVSAVAETDGPTAPRAEVFF